MLVSVVIITRNRLEDIRFTLKKYLAQNYEHMEIIVIDNASDDGTKEKIPVEFPEIKYMWLPDNHDIKAINIGIELSKGDIIWRTDDDSHPESPDAFNKAVEIFKNQKDVDIICTEDIEINRNNTVWEWYPYEVDKKNIPPNGYKAHTFPGTGAAIKREIYDKVGGFWGFGFEEIEFCTRAILAGYNVRYFPNIRTLHYASPSNRISDWRYTRINSQLVRYYWRYFPFWKAFSITTFYYFLQLFYGILRKVSFTAWLELVYLLPATALRTIREERRIVPKEKIKDITLGVSAIKSELKFLVGIIKNKFKKGNKS
jgi:GT2 family glycosyltransferase